MHTPLKGRGTSANPSNRFEPLTYVLDPEYCDEDDGPDPRATILRDPSRSILSRNTSPDVGFNISVNPYRGCQHDCVYCYARPTHEWLGFSAGLDFETLRQGGRTAASGKSPHLPDISTGAARHERHHRSVSAN